MSDLIERINAVGDRLESQWIPKAFAPSRRILLDAKDDIENRVQRQVSTGRVQKFQMAEMLDIKAQRRLALEITSTPAFRKSIPVAMQELRAALMEAYVTAAATIYKQVAEAIAHEYDKLSPAGVEISAGVTQKELSDLRILRYEGATYGESLLALLFPVPRRIKQIVVQSISDFGRSADALKSINQQYDGVWSRLERDLETKFRQYMLLVDKRAELSLSEVKAYGV